MLKTDFFWLELQAGDTTVRQIMPLSQVPERKHQHPAACGELRGGSGTCGTQEADGANDREHKSTPEAQTPLIFFKGSLMQT